MLSCTQNWTGVCDGCIGKPAREHLKSEMIKMKRSKKSKQQKREYYYCKKLRAFFFQSTLGWRYSYEDRQLCIWKIKISAWKKRLENVDWNFFKEKCQSSMKLLISWGKCWQAICFPNIFAHVTKFEASVSFLVAVICGMYEQVNEKKKIAELPSGTASEP